MGRVSPPIKECKILFRYNTWTADKTKLTWYEDSFSTIPKLKKYFLINSAAGPLVKYGKASPGEKFASAGYLRLEWTDSAGFFSKDFITAGELADFLRSHPELAKVTEFEV